MPRVVNSELPHITPVQESRQYQQSRTVFSRSQLVTISQPQQLAVTPAMHVSNTPIHEVQFQNIKVPETAIVSNVGDPVTKASRIIELSKLLESIKINNKPLLYAELLITQSFNTNALLNTIDYDLFAKPDQGKKILEYFNREKEAALILENRKLKAEGCGPDKHEKKLIGEMNKTHKLLLQEDLKQRDISAANFDALALGINLDNQKNCSFAKEKTIFCSQGGISDLSGNPIDQGIEMLKAIKGDRSIFKHVYIYVNRENPRELDDIFKNIYALLKTNGFVIINLSELACKKYPDKSFSEEILSPSGFPLESIINLPDDFNIKCDKWQEYWLRNHTGELTFSRSLLASKT